MPASSEAVKTSEHIYRAGAIDRGTRDFRGYTTSRGSTYGAYLIVADVLTYIVGLKPKNLVGAASGSSGWSGEGAKMVGELLDRMNIQQVRDPLRMKYVPDDGKLESRSEV